MRKTFHLTLVHSPLKVQQNREDINAGVDSEELITLRKSEFEKICKTMVSLKHRVSELERVYSGRRSVR